MAEDGSTLGEWWCYWWCCSRKS